MNTLEANAIIRQKLNLMPADEFEYVRLLEGLEEKSKSLPFRLAVESRFRSTGRTTNMIVRALASAMANGEEVLIIGNGPDATERLRRMARQWAERAGIDARLVANTAIRERAGSIHCDHGPSHQGRYAVED